MVRMLVILAAMRLFRSLIPVVVLGGLLQCSPAVQPASKVSVRNEMAAVESFLRQIMPAPGDLPVYYYTPDSLYLLGALTSAGHTVRVMATEADLPGMAAMPEYQGAVSDLLVLAPAGLKPGRTAPGFVLFDRPLQKLSPEYLQVLLSQSMSLLPTGGRVVLVQTPSQSKAQQKQITTLSEQVAFSRAIIDSTHSKRFHFLIFEK